MKTLLAFFVFAVAAFAQNPNPCQNIQNTATSGQVLSAASNGRTPACKWIANGGGGGGTIAHTNNTLRGDNAGNAIAITGTGTNCVLVNGSSQVCGGGGVLCATADGLLYGSTGACDTLLTWDSSAKQLTVGPSGVADNTFARFGYSGIPNSGSVEIYAKNDNNDFTAALSLQADENNSDGAGFVQAANIVAKATNTSGNVSVVGAKVEADGTASGGASPTLTALNLGVGNTTSVTTLIGLSINNMTGASTNYAIKTGLGINSFGDAVQTPLIQLTGTAFASLGTPTNGTQIYCSDCTLTGSLDNTCANSGTGAFAERLNGAWKCGQ